MAVDKTGFENEDTSKPDSEELVPLNDNKCKENTKKDAKTKLTLKEKFKKIRQNITVEPVLACYIMPSCLASLALQNLNLEKACRVNLNFTTEICDALTRRETENYTRYEAEVQTLTASITGWKIVIQTAIPIFLILFGGSWSDKTGRRKILILSPILGDLTACLGYMVNTYFFYELPVEATALTEAIFTSITGGWFLNYVGVFSYIADITTTEERTYRVGIVNLFSNLGMPVGNALSGILFSWLGYYGVFSISVSLYVFSLIYGHMYLVDHKREAIEKQKDYKKPNTVLSHIKDFFDIHNVMETFRVVFKKGEGNRRLRVSMLLIVVCVVFGPLHGEFTVMYLFTRYKFNWNEVQFSLWSTYAMVTTLLGTMFSMSLFSNYMKLDDTLLGIISNTSKIVAGFAYAFARNGFEFYLAPLLEILNGTSFIAMRSIATKLVSGEELGKVMSLFGLAEVMMPIVYGPLYTRVYMATLHVLPGAVFLLGGAMTVPALFIFGWLYFEHKKDKALAAEENNKKPVEAETKV